MTELFIMPLIDTAYVVDFVMGVRREVVGMFEPLTSVASALAAGFAVFYLVLSCGRIMAGNELRLWELAKPFVLLICISQFSTVVVGPLDAIMGSVDAGLSSLALKNEDYADFGKNFLKAQVEKAAADKKLDEQRDKAVGKVSVGDAKIKAGTEIAKAAGGDKKDGNGASDGTAGAVKVVVDNSNTPMVAPQQKESKLPKWLQGISDWFDGLVLKAERSITSALCSLCFFLFSCACTMLKILAQLYLAILSLLGPFVFAFGMFPGHDIKQNVMGWIDRYLQVSLWPAIASIIYIMVTMTMKRVLDNMPSLSASDAEQVANLSGVSLSLGLLLGACFVICCAGIFMLTKVKEVSGIVIQSAGMGGLGGLGHSAMRKMPGFRK